MENYAKAVQLADIALMRLDPAEFYSKITFERLTKPLEPQDYFKRVRAHRYYQYVMCKYKMLKYYDISLDNKTKFGSGNLING